VPTDPLAISLALCRRTALAAALAGMLTVSCGAASRVTTPVAEPASRRPAPPPAAPAPPSVVLHQVRPGETLWRITRAYGADLDEVIVVNNLDGDARITAGQTLLIPAPHRMPAPGETVAERRAAPPPSAEGLSALEWPLHGAVQSGYGPRGRRHHDGIDIDGRRGDPIHAAAAGRVVFAGWKGDYGKMIVVDHGDGLSTLYAHADELRVRSGRQVRAGEIIGRVGRTGNAQGTHLHFEVHVDSRTVDPLGHLPVERARAGPAR